MPTLAEYAREVMLERGETHLSMVAFGMLDEIYHRFGGRVVHPLDRQKAVKDAVRRSKMFRHDGYIRCCDTTGRREILHPRFELIEVNTHIEEPDA